MIELKKYITSSHLLIAPYLDVKCFGVNKELCTDRKEVRVVRCSLLN